MEMGDRGGFVTKDDVNLIEIEIAGYDFISVFIISCLMIFISFIYFLS